MQAFTKLIIACAFAAAVLAQPQPPLQPDGDLLITSAQAIGGAVVVKRDLVCSASLTVTGSVSVVGDITLSNAAALTVTGPVSAGIVTVNKGTTLTVTGNVKITELSCFSRVTITGLLTVVTLTKGAGCVFVNTVPASAEPPLQSDGDLLITSARAVGAPVVVPGNLVCSAAFTVTGSLSVAGDITLSNSAALTVTGPVTAGLVTVNAGTALTITGAVKINELSCFSRVTITGPLTVVTLNKGAGCVFVHTA